MHRYSYSAVLSGVFGFVVLFTLQRLCAQDPFAPAPAEAVQQDPFGPAPVEPGQVPAEAAKGPAVLLERSFEVPQGEADRLATHTPLVVFTPDGKRMVTFTSGGELLTFDRQSQAILTRSKLTRSIAAAVSIDPQGRVLVAATSRGVGVFDVAGGRRLRLDRTLNASCIAISPNAEMVAISQGSELELRSLPKLGRLFTLTGHQSDITNVAWSSDGKMLGSTGSDGSLAVYDVDARKARYAIKKEEALHAVAFHPQGRFVAYGGVDRQVYQYEWATRKETVVTSEQPYWITCLGYSPDGEIIAVGDESCDIWLYDRKAHELLFHSKHHDECWLTGVSFAPDSETFVFGCRPNDHAQTPSTYAPLLLAEAVQAKEVSQRRDGLLKQIDARLKEMEDEELRASINSYRELLVAQDKSANFASDAAEIAGVGAASGMGGGMMGGMGGGYGMGGMGASSADFDGFMGNLSLIVGESGAPTLGSTSEAMEKLPGDLRELATQYQESIQKEVSRLNQHHRINQWKVEHSAK